MVLKTAFGQSLRWSLIRGTLGVEYKEKNNLTLRVMFLIDKMSLFQVVVNSGISLYEVFISF